MRTTSSRRAQRASAARILLDLHASDALANADTWTWQALDRLPAWCLLGTPQREEIQLLCGALFISPDLRYWIKKNLLMEAQRLLGEKQLNQIIKHADAMQLPREPLGAVFAEAGFDVNTASPGDLEELLMGTGASVLKASVHQSLPQDMLLASLGKVFGDVSPPAAITLMEVAVELQKALTDPELRAS